MNQARLTIYIVTRDRPELFRKAIDSAINQNTKHKYQIVISDNSIGDETLYLVTKEYKNIEYVRRNNISVFDHFQCILNENKSEFLVMLHDDDSLCKAYSEIALSKMLIDKNISAIATRPNYIYSKKKLFHFNNINTNDIEIDKVEQLLRLYFYENKSSNPPFSSYMFRKSSIEFLKFNTMEAGKYSDFTFLLKIAETGKILWLNERLFNVGIHDSNDSNTESITAYHKLFNYLEQKYNLSKNHKYINTFKIKIFIRYLKKNKFKRRNYILIKYILLNFHLLLSILYFKILKK